MTFSIVAIDSTNGDVGFAIASCCWDAGQVCMARPGQGAMASQANGNVGFLGIFFDKLQEGMTLDDILSHLRSVDPYFETRQIGMIDMDGNTVSFTGDKCSHWCGSISGEHHVCQGNILVGPEVLEAMSKTFISSKGALFFRLYEALVAADAAGGDARGRQSARVCVRRKGSGAPGTDTFLDIVIEDHEEPVKEIGRVLEVGKGLMGAYGRTFSFDEADDAERKRIIDDVEGFLDGRHECRYLDLYESLGEMYMKIGDVDRAVMTYERYLEIAPTMKDIFRKNAEKGNFSLELAERLGLL